MVLPTERSTDAACLPATAGRCGISKAVALRCLVVTFTFARIVSISVTATTGKSQDAPLIATESDGKRGFEGNIRHNGFFHARTATAPSARRTMPKSGSRDSSSSGCPSLTFCLLSPYQQHYAYSPFGIRRSSTISFSPPAPPPSSSWHETLALWVVRWV